VYKIACFLTRREDSLGYQHSFRDHQNFLPVVQQKKKPRLQKKQSKIQQTPFLDDQKSLDKKIGLQELLTSETNLA